MKDFNLIEVIEKVYTIGGTFVWNTYFEPGEVVKIALKPDRVEDFIPEDLVQIEKESIRGSVYKS